MRVLLLSGGLESSALAYSEKPDLCITINYGQPPAAGEIRSARAICSELDLEHQAISVPAYSKFMETRPVEGSSLFWPLRNQLLVTLAGIQVASFGRSELILGLVADDIYGDCRAEFISGLNGVLDAQQAELSVVAPAIGLSTLQLLIKSGVPKELLSLTLSCHVADYACGRCAGCLKSKAVLRRYRRPPSLSLVVSK